MRQGVMPVGSRRRRAALQDSSNIPFEQLPYQCFQDARQILLADRAEKLKEIESVRAKLARVQALSTEEAGGEQSKKSRVVAFQLHLERLKILADINDPIVKKRSEDGQGNYCMGLVYGMILIVTRRHEQTHLPLSGRSEMEGVPTQDSGPENYADEGHSRRPP